nr:proline-rich receptor-like protein kinase PERK9 isoform X1 [Taeniopygia guttata]
MGVDLPSPPAPIPPGAPLAPLRAPLPVMPWGISPPPPAPPAAPRPPQSFRTRSRTPHSGPALRSCPDVAAQLEELQQVRQGLVPAGSGVLQGPGGRAGVPPEPAHPLPRDTPLHPPVEHPKLVLWLQRCFVWIYRVMLVAGGPAPSPWMVFKDFPLQLSPASSVCPQQPGSAPRSARPCWEREALPPGSSLS